MLAVVLAVLAVVIAGAADADPPACAVETPGAPACGATPDPGSHPRTPSAPRYVGNPIDVVSGNKYRREDDFRALGSPLAFSRHYNSALVDHDVGLGPGWRHSYQVYLTRADADTLRIVQSDGRRIGFTLETPSADGDTRRYRSPGDGVVDAAPGHHVWHRPDGRRVTFQGSWPVRFELAGVPSETLILRYERRRLASVSDAFGRTLRLRYTPGRTALPGYDEATDITLPGHLESLLLPGGREVTFRYDNRANPVVVRYPDGRDVRFDYEDPAWPHHLTARDDASGQRAWRYDAFGRAVAYRDAASGEALAIERDDAADGLSGEARVVHERGATSVYRWTGTPGETGSIGATDVRVTTLAERRCPDCDELVRHPTPPTGEPVEPSPHAPEIDTTSAPDVSAEVSVDPSPAPSLRPSPDDPYTLTGTDERGRTVAVRGNARGDVVDVERDGVSLDDLAADLASGGGAACGDPVRCLVELGELLDIANAATRPPSPPFRTRSRDASTPPAARFCTLPGGRTCAELERDEELAHLARCAYPDETCVTLYEPVSAASIGLDPKLLEREGFAARISRHRRTGEYVVAFRGTDDVWHDLREDFMQFAGEVTPQYRHARQLAELLKDLLPNERITYTGHSLGGGLATVAALTTKDEAIVFNAASLHERTADTLKLDLEDADGLVHNLAIDGEIVTTLQDRAHYPPGYRPPEHDPHVGRPPKTAHPAPGRRYTLPRPPDDWLAAQKARSSALLQPETVRLHLMESVMESIRTLREIACDA